MLTTRFRLVLYTIGTKQSSGIILIGQTYCSKVILIDTLGQGDDCCSLDNIDSMKLAFVDEDFNADNAGERSDALTPA